jgi:hypothetical protein
MTGVDTGIPDDNDRSPVPTDGRLRAAGIYGTIITAAVIAAGGNVLSTAALEATVLVTLVVYWVAEQYAELLGEHTQAGRLPALRQVRASFAASWPMVSASFLPLMSLLIARLLGTTALGAAQIALVVTVVLLVYHGHAAGKSAGLRGLALIAVTGTAAVLGIVMIVLKVLLQHQHHLY